MYLCAGKKKTLTFLDFTDKEKRGFTSGDKCDGDSHSAHCSGLSDLTQWLRLEEEEEWNCVSWIQCTFTASLNSNPTSLNSV